MNRPIRPSVKNRISRRNFLKSTSAAVAGGAVLNSSSGNSFGQAVAGNPEASLTKPFAFGSTQSIEEPTVNRRLTSGWEYRRGSLGGPWEAWRKGNDDAKTWARGELQQCFHAT